MQVEMEKGGRLFFDLFVAMCNHMVSFFPPRRVGDCCFFWIWVWLLILHGFCRMMCFRRPCRFVVRRCRRVWVGRYR